MDHDVFWKHQQQHRAKLKTHASLPQQVGCIAHKVIIIEQAVEPKPLPGKIYDFVTDGVLHDNLFKEKAGVSLPADSKHYLPREKGRKRQARSQVANCGPLSRGRQCDACAPHNFTGATIIRGQDRPFLQQSHLRQPDASQRMKRPALFYPDIHCCCRAPLSVCIVKTYQRERRSGRPLE